MTLTEIFSEHASKIIGYLKELVYLVLSPRKFFRTVAAEATNETIYRLTVYTSCYAIIEIALFTAVLRLPTISSYEVVGIALLEATFSLFVRPVLLGVAYVLRIEQPLKTSLAYALSGRFLFLTPALVSYALFLMTENYGFALVRGVLVQAYVLVYVLMFPLALSKSIKQRALAVVITIATTVSLMLAVAWITLRFSTQMSRFEEFSLLYDPIGAEVDRLGIRFDAAGTKSEIRVMIDGGSGDCHCRT